MRTTSSSAAQKDYLDAEGPRGTPERPRGDTQGRSRGPRERRVVHPKGSPRAVQRHDPEQRGGKAITCTQGLAAPAERHDGAGTKMDYSGTAERSVLPTLALLRALPPGLHPPQAFMRPRPRDRRSVPPPRRPRPAARALRRRGPPGVPSPLPPPPPPRPPPAPRTWKPQVVRPASFAGDGRHDAREIREVGAPACLARRTPSFPLSAVPRTRRCTRRMQPAGRSTRRDDAPERGGEHAARDDGGAGHVRADAVRRR